MIRALCAERERGRILGCLDVGGTTTRRKWKTRGLDSWPTHPQKGTTTQLASIQVLCMPSHLYIVARTRPTPC